MKHVILFVIVLVFPMVQLYARHGGYNGYCKLPDEDRGKLTVGFRVGASHSRIGSVRSVLESGDKKPTYSWENGFYIAPTLAIFGQYRIDIVGFELEGTYYSEGEKMSYGNTLPKPIRAQYKFVNHYIGANLNLKLFLTRGIYMGVSGRYGFLMGDQNIDYRCDDTNAKRLDLRKQLNEQISTTDEVGVGVILGWEHKSGFHTEIRYMYGLVDMLNVEKSSNNGIMSNSYGYTDCICQTNWVSLTAGFSITIFDNLKKLNKCKRHNMLPYWRH